jgi:hypothetical protein
VPRLFKTVFRSKQWNGRIDPIHQNHVADFACRRSGIMRRGLRHFIDRQAMGTGKIRGATMFDLHSHPPRLSKSLGQKRPTEALRAPSQWYAPMVWRHGYQRLKVAGRGIGAADGEAQAGFALSLSPYPAMERSAAWSASSTCYASSARLAAGKAATASSDLSPSLGQPID